jgi:hypothetical protein
MSDRDRYFSPEAAADLETAHKIVRLARMGERHLVEFLLEFAAVHLQRTAFDQALDHYLETEGRL